MRQPLYPLTPPAATGTVEYPRSASHSRRVLLVETVSTSRVRWRVERCGAGPVVVLLHGTGAAGRSWTALRDRLLPYASLIIPDLPGHGDSMVLDWSVMSLPALARETEELMGAIGVDPSLIVGHSAGAALAVRMALDDRVKPQHIVSVNGAFATFGGALDRLFGPLAGLCASSSLVTSGLARKARDPNAIKRIIESTGSQLDEDSLSVYAELLQKPSHLQAVFAMMANWDLRSLRRDMGNLNVPLHLLVADNDRAVDPRSARDVMSRCRQARITRLAGLGHIAHEEDPDGVAELIIEELQKSGVG